MIKERISNLLLSAARKINPSSAEVVENIPEVVGYDSRKIGLAVTISKNELRKYKKENNVSERDARREMIADAKSEIRKYINGVISKNSLIEYETKTEGRDIVVEGEMKIYIRSNEC